MSFYAVARGRKVGIYQTWDECKQQTDKFSGQIFKKFRTIEEAEEFIAKHSNLSDSKSEGNNNCSRPDKCATDEATFKQTSKPLQAISGLCIVSKATTSEFNPRKRVLETEFAHDGSVIVYTDGACVDNGKRGIGVFWADNHPDNLSIPLEGRPTNNRAEIHAAIKALRKAKERGYTKVTIRTDSQFLLDSATKWIHGWVENGWRLSTGQPVKNEVDFKELIQVMNELELVNWEKVAGHQGIYGNDQADRLARNGITSASNKRFKSY